MRRFHRLLWVGPEACHGRETIAGINDYRRIHTHWEIHIERFQGAESLPHVHEMIRQWKADGIIGMIRGEHIENLAKSSGWPAVSVSGAYSLNLPAVVRVDDEAIGRMIARKFLDGGFRNFAFCAYSVDEFCKHRGDSFAAELAKAGHTCDAFTEVHTGRRQIDWVTNQALIGKWLKKLPKPVAMMCVYDIRGHEVVTMCRRIGLRVPEDIAVISVGNDDVYCLGTNPPLSSVALDLRRVGFEALRCLESMIRGKPAPREPIMIPPVGLVTRQSSDIVAIDEPDVAAAMRFIQRNAETPISVKDLLREVPICRRKLERHFVSILGRTPHKEIDRVRMERAKHLLSGTDLPIPEVARRSGYSSHVIFSTSFRRNMGIPPTLFRKNTRMAAMQRHEA